MTGLTITITREHYERLKNDRVVLFGENNGEWTDEELEGNAISAAIEAAGEIIEGEKLLQIPISEFTQEQFKALIQWAAWAYMKVYVEYVPF
ncbi:MAG: hypothetical protein HN356_01655 [Calditrichaeota bacterium]|nr:hypothetical protein [Calditrichota bacterium]MBT7788783.1 hypothetical protein [Calditrichota bacterium]